MRDLEHDSDDAAIVSAIVALSLLLSGLAILKDPLALQSLAAYLA